MKGRVPEKDPPSSGRPFRAGRNSREHPHPSRATPNPFDATCVSPRAGNLEKAAQGLEQGNLNQQRLACKADR